ncbi:MAG: DegT/DnrJ/EryC1/StrS family aminotransferase [Phycisphaerae bacterium]|nr:DegT/DnrJ/EryC1/StrS family aminotransferase [Phycisphaerae bacterium]
MDNPIPLSLPDITDLEIQAVVDVLRTNRLSLGPRQVAFEEAIRDFVGARYACALSSGTAALHLALLAAGVGPGDEVITSSFSFIASANCALYVGAKPVFADIDPATWNIDPDALEAAITPKTKAVIPVHVFGQPCRMDRIMAAAKKHSLAVVEDSCEAIGAAFGGRKAGTIGQSGTFAFYPNKQITTGEGGMLVTDDEKVASLARSLRNQGRAEKATWLAHERLGYNYRMCELQAALGEAQMKRISDILAKRARAAGWYTQRLAGFEKLRLQKIEPDVTMSWFVFVIRLADEFSQEHRDRLIAGLGQQGIGCNAYFTPIHLQTFYREQLGCRPGQLPVTEKVGERSLAIPFFSNISEGQVDRVCGAIRRIVDGF